jgi:phosphomannomutase
MIPALLILELLSVRGMRMSRLIAPLKEKYFISGEINVRVEEPLRLLKKIQKSFSDGQVSLMDGVSVEYPEWRFNLRPSQTEPLIRLNVETRAEKLLKEKTELLLRLIGQG